LSKVGGTQKRRQEHGDIEKFLRGNATRFEEGGIFESFIFGEAADQKLHE
jgi:hypothetical protein